MGPVYEAAASTVINQTWVAGICYLAPGLQSISHTVCWDSLHTHACPHTVDTYVEGQWNEEVETDTGQSE